MYVSYHNKVARYTPTLEKTVLLDGDTSEMSLNAAIGVVFDPQSQALFICDDRLRKVIKFPLSIDDSSNNRVVEYTDLPFDPEYLAIDDAQNVIVSSPSSNTLVVIAPNGNRKLIECDNIMRYVIGIETIAIGGKGFDKKSVYATGWDGGHVYKIPLPAFEDE
jgi:sugar lactone lactonase YvrE